MTNLDEDRNIRIKDVSKKNGVTLLNSNPAFDKTIEEYLAWREYLVFMDNFNNNLKLLWN